MSSDVRIDKGEAVILFDGVCNLCIGSVQFILKRDLDSYFKFGSLQSPQGRELAQEFGLAADNLTTLLLLEGDRFYTHSDAALRIVGRLSGLWPLMRVFQLVPRPIRDWCYDWIARNRYKWFGKRAECMVPTPEIEERFLDSNGGGKK